MKIANTNTSLSFPHELMNEKASSALVERLRCRWILPDEFQFFFVVFSVAALAPKLILAKFFDELN